MRSGYDDGCGDCSEADLNLYRGNVDRATTGKRGQRLLREALEALDAMPVKRLISGVFVRGSEACLLGVVGQARGITDFPDIDPDDDDDGHHADIAGRLDVAECLIREVEYINDECGPYGRPETPEERYERVRKWLVRSIVSPAAGAKG